MNFERFTDTAHEFVRHLSEEEMTEAWFQQDRATCGTTRSTLLELSVV
jgi:hypothetical protein